MKLNTIIVGDVLEKLAELPAVCVQAVVTSPPYWGLRDYGVEGQIGLEKTPEEYTAKMVLVFREVRRVLRDDGTLWLNLGDSYTSGGRSGHGSHIGFKQETNQGCLSVRSTRPEQPKGLKPKDLIGLPWRVAFALQADGWYLRSDIIWSKPNPMPEPVTDRPTKAHEYIFLMTKNPRYYYDAEAVREEGVGTPWHGVGGYREGNIDNSYKPREHSHDRPTTGHNRRTVWEIPTQPYPEAHFATFPEKLVEPCILAGSKPEDVILDPFMGAGTTALVALKAGRNFLGIELNPEYADLARRRIAQELNQGKLF